MRKVFKGGNYIRGNTVHVIRKSLYFNKEKNLSPALGSYLVEQLRFERYANCNNSGPAPPYDHWAPISKAVRFPCCTVPIDDKECKYCVRLLSVIL